MTPAERSLIHVYSVCFDCVIGSCCGITVKNIRMRWWSVMNCLLCIWVWSPMNIFFSTAVSWPVSCGSPPVSHSCDQHDPQRIMIHAAVFTLFMICSLREEFSELSAQALLVLVKEIAENLGSGNQTLHLHFHWILSV